MYQQNPQKVLMGQSPAQIAFMNTAYEEGYLIDVQNDPSEAMGLDGNNVNSVGLTLGVTLPVFRWYNGISIGVDLGQRASRKNNMIRERYATFTVGFNIHDIWFQKPRYN